MEIDFEEISDSKFRRYLEQRRGSEQVLDGLKWKKEEEERYGQYVSYDDWRENSPEQRAEVVRAWKKAMHGDANHDGDPRYSCGRSRYVAGRQYKCGRVDRQYRPIDDNE
jgi:hypothetical protein